jgi:hypothetical protein
MKVVATKQIAAGARAQALKAMGNMFKCTPEKAAERMARPNPKYKPYRVAFHNLVDAAITHAFKATEQANMPIAPAHWSAVIGKDAARIHATDNDGRGALVSYWAPGATA